MSETHPSAPKLSKGRRNQRLRKLTECWPLLVWFGVLGIAIYGYNKGVVFTRMNGAVDVVQFSIAPTEDGRFKELAPGIETGARVEKDQIVAYMDETMIDLDIRRFMERKRESGGGDVSRAQRYLHDAEEDLLDVDRKLARLDLELQSKRRTLSEVKTISTTEAVQAAAKLDLEILFAEAEKTLYSQRRPAIEETIANQKQDLANIRNGTTSKIGTTSENVILDPEDREQLNILNLRKERLTLRAKHAGIVDRIGKDAGEFVEAGEFIVKVVAEPTQILGFLPQDQVNATKEGDTVWLSNSIDRYEYFESKIVNLSPRLDSRRDAASPLPNQAVRGRIILIDYPEECKFLPGQTVIIHIKPPGEVPFLGRIFGS